MKSVVLEVRIHVEWVCLNVAHAACSTYCIKKGSLKECGTSVNPDHKEADIDIFSCAVFVFVIVQPGASAVVMVASLYLGAPHGCKCICASSHKRVYLHTRHVHSHHCAQPSMCTAINVQNHQCLHAALIHITHKHAHHT